MIKDGKILIGKGNEEVYLLPSMANRHGLIAGATGTGKTVTLKVLAEGFSQMGVPVFLADVKGDISSIALAGNASEKVTERLEQCGVSMADPVNPFKFWDFPCRFWDVYGRNGIPFRATITDVGPMLLARLLGLTDVQAGVLNIAFHVADDEGLALIDLKDLRAMLTFLADNKADYTVKYGNITTQTIGAIQRALLLLEDQGADCFFGEPAIALGDLFAADEDGLGLINILHCTELFQNPLLYATTLMYLLGELYEQLPEVGDPEKPRFVFFFDEAHLLFKDAPKAFVDKVIQLVKLIRSKGVGLYFITQSPADIPDEVLAQLNNRIQHALRAYTPAEQKAIRVAASSFRPNPAFKTEDAITTMGTGVALVSTLEANGAPSIVEQATILPPQSGFTSLSDAARAMLVSKDCIYAEYKDAVDNESAYEILTAQQEEEAARVAEIEAEKAAEKAEKEAQKAELQAQKEAERAERSAIREQAQAEREARAAERAAKAEERAAARALQEQYKAEGKDKYGRTKMQASIEKAAKSTAKTTTRTFGRNIGQSITRGVMGTSKNNTVSRAVGQFTGSIASDIVGSFFKR